MGKKYNKRRKLLAAERSVEVGRYSDRQSRRGDKEGGRVKVAKDLQGHGFNSWYRFHLFPNSLRIKPGASKECWLWGSW